MAKETIAFRVEKEIIDSIEAYAERLGTSKSNIAEMALTIFAELTQKEVDGLRTLVSARKLAKEGVNADYSITITAGGLSDGRS